MLSNSSEVPFISSMLYYIKTPVPLDINNKFCRKIFFCFLSLSLCLCRCVCLFVLILLTNLYCTWTNLSYQDKTWVEFSTLEDAVCMLLPTKWPNLELKTKFNQLLGSLPLDIALPIVQVNELMGLPLIGTIF